MANYNYRSFRIFRAQLLEKQRSFKNSFLRQAKKNPLFLPDNRSLNFYDMGTKLNMPQRRQLRGARAPFFLLPGKRLRIFTERFAKSLPNLRLSLRNMISASAYSSYVLPFHFTRKNLLS